MNDKANQTAYVAGMGNVWSFMDKLSSSEILGAKCRKIPQPLVVDLVKTL